MTYTLPPATTPFVLANRMIFTCTEHISNNITVLYQSTFRKNLTMHIATPQSNILSSHVTLTYNETSLENGKRYRDDYP